MHQRIFTLLSAAILSALSLKSMAQQPALVITGFFANPASTDDNKEFVELTATRAINFSTNNYCVVVSDGTLATTADGWVTGGTGTYAINLSTGSVTKGQKVYVGGNNFTQYLTGGSSCVTYPVNTTSSAGAAFANGRTGTAASAGVIGNGGSHADGMAVFSSAASLITNTTMPIDAILFGDAVGNATGKFILPTNDRYDNAQGKYGAGTNTYTVADPGGNYALGTGSFDTLMNTFITPRIWTNPAISTSAKQTCTVASTLTLTAANNLAFTVNTTTTTGMLLPPNISGVISDATDPAASLGVDFDVKSNSTAIAATDYTITAASNNTAVVPAANITITKSNGVANVKINPAGVGYSTITLTLNKSGLLKTYTINYAASATTGSNVVSHTGYSDGSSAYAIDNDYMVVVDDEKNDLNVYSRKNSGLPVKTYAYGSLLGLTDLSGGVPREIDAEAIIPSLANTGRLYAIGSMSNQSTGSYNDRPNRDRIMALNVSGTGSATSFSLAGYYTGLRSKLISWGATYNLGLAASANTGEDPKTATGFNIEGMAFAPNATTLYIGFRAPLLPISNRINAVIAPLQNFETWFNNGSPAGNPTFGSPILLNLAGRGIRELVRQDANTILIIAGDVGSGNLTSQIYNWNGNANDAPVLLNGFNTSGLNPEGLLNVYNSGTIQLNKVQVISDFGDNDYYNDGTAAKDLTINAFKKFRTDLLTSPGTPLPVRFTSFEAHATATNNVQLSWSTAATDIIRFEVERSETGGDFVRIGTVNATEEVMAYKMQDIITTNEPVLYYRIKAITASGAAYYTNISMVRFDRSGTDIHLYPNPATGNTLSVSGIADQAAVNYRVLSVDGKEMYSGAIVYGSGEINIANLPVGYYHLILSGANGFTTVHDFVRQ